MLENILSPEAGHFALALACCMAGAQFILPLIGVQTNNRRLINLAPALAWGQFIALAFSFACLVTASICDDFSVLNILQNSASDKPLLYKITGVWGNHEGSILLWALILGICGAVVSSFSQNLPFSLRARVIAILGGSAAGFELFCLTTSNPFKRIWPAPMEGQGMNPLLQDPGLAFHPPILYAGYVGFAVPFAFAIAALIEGRVDAAWGRWVRPWTVLAWSLLTIGITLGSWWSYYILGWGGYWFWDPVENASLLPWLTGTALLHCALVVEKREALKIWTILLAIGTFSLSLSGTFLVRSGILNSVHAFAADPSRGIFILILLAIISGGSLLLFAWRAPNLVQEGIFAPFSREGAIVLNNILLCSMAAVVLTGTLYPPFIQLLTGQSLSVGKPFFDTTLTPIALLLLIGMAIAPLLPFKKARWQPIALPIYIAGGLTVISAVGLYFYAYKILPAIASGIGIGIIISAIMDFIRKIALFQTPLKNSFHRLLGLPRAYFATHLAHIGIAITTLGIVGMAFSQQKIVEIHTGETVHLAGYEWQLSSIQQGIGPNYRSIDATIAISRKGKAVTWLFPSQHYFPRQRQMITNVAIHTNLIADFYVVLGEKRGSNVDPLYILRFYYNPLAPWIWLGGFTMALGGLITLTDRRFRVGILSKKTRKPSTKAKQA